MRRILFFGLLIMVLVMGSGACNMPTQGAEGNGEAEQSQLDTAVAATMQAREQDGENGGGEQENTNTPLPPTDKVPPSATFTPSATATWTLTPTITFTPTSEVPMVSVSVSTNCRVGPGKVYDRVGALLEGEEAEIVAKDSQGLYWYIRNPDKEGGFCWLWGNYASTTGDTGSLPVFTPPPTPTSAVAFTVSFKEVDNCGANWYVEFNIKNTGNLIFQSVRIQVTDNNTSETVTNQANEFTDWNGCVAGVSQVDLIPGESGNTTSGALSNNPSGHNLSATIKLCSENGLGGECVNRSISFTP
jgi:hypothetical protein